MIIDCTTCPVQGIRCEDCAVTALLTPQSSDLPLDAAERQVVARLVSAGLVAADEAASARARREPWRGHRAVG